MQHASATHTVFNQTPPLGEYNLFATDLALREAVRREGAAAAVPDLDAAGAALGTAAAFDDARSANRSPPVLHSFNVQGERIDSVEFHPAWHRLMQGIAARGYHAGPWARVEGAAVPGAHAARAAGYLMQAQVECGTLCPTTMTYGAIAAMRRDAWLERDWVSRIVTREYDPRDIPIEIKRGGLIGMGMTEKQGGSDVRANSSRAIPAADGSYRITGHKWFFSAPQCDAHLVLAQTDGRLSCFFMPRRLPDGTLNGIYIQRLKDKLGNRSNASSEVEFVDAWAHRMGEEGRGIATILEMGTYTRLDCVTGTAGMMRQAVVQSMHHARHRKAFGALLIDQPLMQNVLADLAIESEAATVLAMRLARAFDSDLRPRDRSSAARSPPPPNSGFASAVANWPRKPWKFWAATATPRNCRWRASCARCRSTRSGRDRAISCAWMCCAPSANPTATREVVLDELELRPRQPPAFRCGARSVCRRGRFGPPCPRRMRAASRKLLPP